MDESLERLANFYGGVDKIPPHVLLEEQARNNKRKVVVNKAPKVEPVVEVPKEPTPKPKAKKAPAKKPKRTYTRKPKEKENATHNIALKILGPSAGLVSIIALVRTGIIQYQYFERSDNVLIAGMMAALLGLVTFILPSVFIQAIRMRKVFISIITFIATLFFGFIAMRITVYEFDYSKNLTENVVSSEEEVVLRARNRVDDINEYLSSNAELLEEYTIEKNIKLQQQQETDPVNQYWIYNRVQTEIAGIQSKIDSITEENGVLKSEKDLLTQTEGYYTMQITTEEDREVSRELDMPLSIALEVAGPLFLALALFL